MFAKFYYQTRNVPLKPRSGLISLAVDETTERGGGEAPPNRPLSRIDTLYL